MGRWPEGCICRWDGDDHYSTIIKQDENCPVHNQEWKDNLARELRRMEAWRVIQLAMETEFRARVAKRRKKFLREWVDDAVPMG